MISVRARTSTRFRLLTGLLALCLTTVELAQASSLKAHVKLLATDTFGASLGEFRVVLFKDSRGHDFASRFLGGTADGIPLGEYMVRVTLDSGEWITRQLRIDREDSLVVLAQYGVTIESGGRAAPVLRGEVEHLPADGKRPTWAKLCGLYNDGCGIAAIDGAGHFSFFGVIPGEYVIIVLNTFGPLMAECLRIPDPDSFVVLDNAKSYKDRVNVRSHSDGIRK